MSENYSRRPAAAHGGEPERVVARIRGSLIMPGTLRGVVARCMTWTQVALGSCARARGCMSVVRNRERRAAAAAGCKGSAVSGLHVLRGARQMMPAVDNAGPKVTPVHLEKTGRLLPSGHLCDARSGGAGETWSLHCAMRRRKRAVPAKRHHTATVVNVEEAVC